MEKYAALKKGEKGINYYYVEPEKDRIQIEFLPRVYFGMGYTPEWYGYIKKIGIKIKPFNIFYFIKDMIHLKEKYGNLKSLKQPRELPIKS